MTDDEARSVQRRSLGLRLSSPDETATRPPDPLASNPVTNLWLGNRRLVNFMIAGLVTSAGAGLTAGLGGAHIPVLVLVLASALITFVVSCAANAVSDDDATGRRRWLWLGFVTQTLLLFGIFGYHTFFDHVPGTYALTVSAAGGHQPDVSYIPLFGEPGGEPQIIETGSAGQNGLITGQTYDIFECTAHSPDGSPWLRYHRQVGSATQIWWAPRQFLKAPTGTAQPDIPSC